MTTAAIYLPLANGTKKPPLVDGWTADPPPPMLPIGPEQNRGKRLDYDIDIDADCPEAVFAGPHFLPETKRMHGRPSVGVTHWWYAAAEGAAYEPFTDVVKVRDPEDGKEKFPMLVEIRTGRGHYTVVPPSRVPVKSNGVLEQLRWFADGDARACDFPRLRTSVLYVAITALIARHFIPDGERWKFYEALSGFLLRLDLPADAVTKILETAADYVKDNDTSPGPAEWVRRTEARLRKNLECSGAPVVAKMIGEHGPAVVKQIRKWCGKTSEVEEAVERLNDRFAIVSVGNKVVVMDNLPDGSIKKLWPFEEFKKLLSKERITIPSTTPTGRPTEKEVPLASLWIKHPDGRRFESLVYDMPGSAERCGPQDYNGYLGFTVAAKAGDWSKNQDHLKKIICGGDANLYAWLFNWMAALVQWPGRHAFTALVLRGGEGVGKGHFAHLMLGALFHPQQYLHIIGAGMLTGQFNEHLSGKVLVFADESTWGGDPKAADKLKGMVTESTVPIERKFLPLVEEPSCLHIVIASNNEWPVAIPRDDRRFVVFDVPDTKRQMESYFTPLRDELRDGGLAALLFDLMDHEIDDVALRHPPITKGKREVMMQSLKPIERWWYEKLVTGTMTFTLIDDKSGGVGVTTVDGWPTSIAKAALHEDYLAFLDKHRDNRTKRSTETELGMFLKKCALVETQRPLAGGGKQHYVWHLPSLAECRGHWAAECGWDGWAEGEG